MTSIDILPITGDNIVNADEYASGFTITGTSDLSDGSTINVTVGTTLSFTAVADAAGNWSQTVAATDLSGLADGSYGVTAQSSDDLATATLQFMTIDTSAPQLTLASTSMTHAPDGSENISLSGTLETAAGTVLHVFDGGQDLGAVQVGGNGEWSFTTDLGAEQPHLLSLTATDMAGNITHLALQSDIPDGTAVLGFSLAGTQVSENGSVVTLVHDGVTTVLDGVSDFQFTDGTVHEGAGSLLVDDLYYYAQNPDVWAAHVDATTHYQQNGWLEGRDPNALFSTSGYLAANPDAKAAGVDPLTYYDQHGWQAGENPSANFDSSLYLLHNPDVAAAGVDPLAHYLEFGEAEGRQAYAVVGKDITHGGFDAEYYLLANPDVAQSGMDAWTHFETYGWKEGRDPNAYFDTKAYLAANPDVAAAGIDPLAHYDEYGWKEGRNPGPNFDAAAYEANNSDVAAAGIDPLLHFLQHGAAEGRASYDIHLS